MENFNELVAIYWPVLVSFVGLVIVLARMKADIDSLKEKVKTLFDLHNNKKD